jgi:isopenicillin N synthase-like dioxygenase
VTCDYLWFRYTPEQSTPASGVLACGAHSDYGMFTLLTTDDVPGLQILPRGGSEWIDVPPRAGAFVVNIGDLLQRWSNDVFKSTVHRVVNHEARERFSMPFFFEPNFDCVGACAPVALVQFSLSLSLSLSLYLVSLCFCSLLF